MIQISPKSSSIFSFIFAIISISLINFCNAQNQPTTGTICAPGEGLEDGVCKPCPPGSYRGSDSANLTCTPCLAGEFSPAIGAMSSESCQACYPGTFSSSPGTALCTKCPNGLLSVEGAKACSPCGPGFTPTYSGNGSCEACPSGSYNDGDPDYPDCKPCPWGLTSDEATTSIDGCRPCNKEDDCFLCPSNTYRLKGFSDCVECPLGTATIRNTSRRDGRGGAMSEDDCIPCPKNTKRGIGQYGAHDGCVKCREGRETKSTGAMYCRVIGQKLCPTNMFENAAGDCQRCQRGFRFDPVNKTCIRCPPGTVSRGGFTTTCRTCPSGQRAETLYGRYCECPPKTYKKGDKCLPCEMGTSSDSYIHRKSCSPCTHGTFQDKKGQINCKQCPFPLVAPEPGSTKCIPCAKKGAIPHWRYFYNSQKAPDTCINGSTICPIGYKRIEEAYGSYRCEIVTCTKNTPKQDVGIKCLPCARGTYFDEKYGSCSNCPHNMVSQGGLTKCTKCPKGFVQSNWDGSKCRCADYLYVGKGLISNGSCITCPPGTYSDVGSQLCEPCKPGTFSNATSGPERCQRCPPYSFSTGGANSCTNCPDGTAPNKRFGATLCV